MHYFKFALKSFTTHKPYPVINIFGLGLSLAVCMVIYLYVSYNRSYDDFFSGAERIYRIGQVNSAMPGGTSWGSSSRVASEFPALFPEIADITRFSTLRPFVVESATLRQLEAGMTVADRRFFQLFSFVWLHGDRATALAQPDAIVLTDSMAVRYFGSTERAFGNTLTLENDILLHVTGVIADLPANTHFDLDAVASIEVIDGFLGPMLGNWQGAVFKTYALLANEASLPLLEESVAAFGRQQLGEQSGRISFNFRKLTDIHLQDSLGASGILSTHLNRIRLFSAIGFATLLIAVVNFVNIATARGSLRILEVGLRATIGATRRQLAVQLLGESALMTICALLLALVLAELLLPALNALLGTDLRLSSLADLKTIALLLMGTLALVIAAGSYPTFLLTSLSPVAALKKEWVRGQKGRAVRAGLLVLQFGIAIVMIAGTLVFMLQMRHVQLLDVGFDSEQVLTVPFPLNASGNQAARRQGLRQALLGHSGIKSVVASLASPLPETFVIGNVTRPGDATERRINLLPVEAEFHAFYGIKLLAGEYFIASGAGPGSLPARPSMPWSDRVIINEAALRVLGWQADEAIGQQLFLPGPDDAPPSTVTGVVENTIANAYSAATPMIYLQPDANNFGGTQGRFNIRIAPGNVRATLAHIDAVWQQFFPETPIQRAFLDERLEANYRSETTQLTLFMYATAFSIGIACVGLFGLATFNAEGRIKEIGVRKVMGGSVWSIVLLLTNDFSKLVLLANVLAWPVAWFVTSRWLENFAYRIDLTPLVLVGSGLIALCIAWVTVGGTAARAAIQKPVLTLRYE